MLTSHLQLLDRLLPFSTRGGPSSWSGDVFVLFSWAVSGFTVNVFGHFTERPVFIKRPVLQRPVGTKRPVPVLEQDRSCLYFLK
jgi:hypothetical protein